MTDYYLCVLDFEATCCDKNEFPRNQMEIIEFPSILYKVENHIPTFISQFHKYVKPTHHPKLTDFCINLTGIQQETVDKADVISIVYKEHIDWIIKNVPINANLIFATCGYWDFKTMLPTEVANKQLKANSIYKKYINVKDEYEYIYKVKAQGMVGMMNFLKIPVEGRVHSGIDDTKNIAKILLKIIKDGNEDFKLNYINLV